MRGATAKALRRQARLLTEGAPAKAYLSRQHQKSREVTTSKEVKAPASGPDGFSRVVKGVRKFFVREKKILRVSSEEIRLDPASTKGMYKMLKRNRRRVVPDLAMVIMERGL